MIEHILAADIEPRVTIEPDGLMRLTLTARFGDDGIAIFGSVGDVLRVLSQCVERVAAGDVPRVAA